MDSSLSALHVLHLLLLRLCWQMLPPPHSLHLLLCRLCWQMPPPPHSLHWLLNRLCSQFPGCLARARFPPPLLPPAPSSGAARLLLPFPLCSSAALLLPAPPECIDGPPPLSPRLLLPPRLPLPTLAGLLSTLPLPLLPPPTAPAPALVAAPSSPASGPASAHAGSLPLPLLPLPASTRPPPITLPSRI